MSRLDRAREFVNGKPIRLADGLVASPRWMADFATAEVQAERARAIRNILIGKTWRLIDAEGHDEKDD